MKICEFCRTENEDNATICTSCAGNSFLYKCNNCGNAFKDGLYCSRCGTKAGQKARKCPYCKTEYFTEACPKCGYLPGKTKTIIEREVLVQKRHTAWWVLGWIFMPSVPITILLARSKKLKPWLKGILIAAVWIVYLLLAGATQKEDTTDTDAPDALELYDVSKTQEPPATEEDDAWVSSVYLPKKFRIGFI